MVSEANESSIFQGIFDISSENGKTHMCKLSYIGNKKC